MQDLYFLITIVRRSDAEEYEQFYRERYIHVVYTAMGNGTAHKKTLDLLGIEKSEKSILFSLVTGETLRGLVRGLSTQMQIDLPDRDNEFCRTKILEMYANPVKNYLIATEG